MNEKQFGIDVIITLATGKLYANPIKVNEALSHILGYEVTTVEIPYIMNIAKEHVLASYPQFANIEPSFEIKSWEDVNKFMEEQAAIHGSLFNLSTLANTTKKTK